MKKINNKLRGEETRERMVKFIKEYFEEHGYAPSVREIGEGTKLYSTSSVQAQMNVLFRMGILETDAPAGTPRAFRLAKPKTE